MQRRRRNSPGGELSPESLQFGGRGRQREKAGLDLEKLVKDIRGRVKETKQFWARLPYQSCNSDSFVANGKLNETCWNGQASGRYVYIGDRLTRTLITSGIDNTLHQDCPIGWVEKLVLFFN